MDNQNELQRPGRYMFVLLFILTSLISVAKECPFSRGVNITNWFQVDSPKKINFLNYSKTDFEQIKSLGCDVVRLPVNLHFMTNGEPDYLIDPIFLNYLDQVVTWSDELSMHLIIDNHTFDVEVNTDPNIGLILEKVWTQLALHYKNASMKLYFEILNEPHGISDKDWNAIQQKVVEAIRKVNTKHTLIIGPASWNSYNNLNAMPIYNDNNLIYTFHFYDPFLFTHQGATWSNLGAAQNIPFPYIENRMPHCPDELKGTWVEGSYNNYRTDGTVAKVKSLIDIAANFAQRRNVPIFCGEFGVFDVYSDPADRVFWYQIVREYLEEKDIAWTIWDYHGGFGIFEKEGYNMFYHDLNIPLVEALGLYTPNQSPFAINPDTSCFIVYDDMIGKNIKNISYGEALLDFFNENDPASNQFCIAWKGAKQYEAIAFDFFPDKDLSYLVKNNYGLSFYLRGFQPDKNLDIRFIDTKTDVPEDHPWRMKITVDEQMLTWNNQWQRIFVPLSDFKEGGSWDNAWFNPEGKFDWSAVDKLEFVAEYGPLGDSPIFIDSIAIIALETIENPNGGNSIQEINNCHFATIHNNFGFIVLSVENELFVNYKMLNVSGKTFASGSFVGEFSLPTGHLISGIYFISLIDENGRAQVTKIRIE